MKHAVTQHIHEGQSESNSVLFAGLCAVVLLAVNGYELWQIERLSSQLSTIQTLIEAIHHD